MKKTIFSFIFLLTTIFAVEIDFEHNGWDRECYLYKPSCIPDEPSDDFEPVPLVLMLHGLGGVGQDNYAFSSLANDSCFILAFPSGMFNTWNAGPGTPYSHDIDDNSYLHALLDTINNNYPIDTNKVYASGHSMGGAMTNHLACTSTRFTALGSSGGWMNFNYMSDNSEYYDVCNPITVGYTIPTTHTHGLSDETVPNQFGQMAAIMLALKNGCDDPFSVNIDNFDLPTMDTFMDMDPSELDAIIDDYLSTADTLYHTGAIHRYQWSNGCHTESNTQLLVMPNQNHAWHQTWNSPISTPLEHWNFFRQFSKDKMAPALDSLILNNGESTVILDDNYESTPVSLLAIDNYGIAGLTISFSGFINVEGFDVTLAFNSENNLLNIETEFTLNSNTSTDNYETVEISLMDYDGNIKTYDMQELQDLGIYQQMAIVNNVTVSTGDDVSTPQTFALHQNYPNPFNPETNINYEIPEDGHVSISIYNMRGTLVKTLVNENQASGFRTVKWDGTNKNGQAVSAGLYMYQIKINDYLETKKMALLK